MSSRASSLSSPKTALTSAISSWSVCVCVCACVFVCMCRRERRWSSWREGGAAWVKHCVLFTAENPPQQCISCPFNLAQCYISVSDGKKNNQPAPLTLYYPSLSDLQAETCTHMHLQTEYFRFQYYACVCVSDDKKKMQILLYVNVGCCFLKLTLYWSVLN